MSERKVSRIRKPAERNTLLESAKTLEAGAYSFCPSNAKCVRRLILRTDFYHEHSSWPGSATSRKKKEQQLFWVNTQARRETKFST